VQASVLPEPSPNDPELTRLSITGSFTATGGNLADGVATLGEGSYIETYMTIPGDMGSTENGTDGRAVHLILIASAGEASIQGQLDVTHEVGVGVSGGDIAPQGGARVVTSTVAFSGQIMQDVDTELFLGAAALTVDGVDALMDDADTSGVADLPALLVLEGALYVPDRPRMVVDLRLESSADKHYSLSGSFTQGDESITVAAVGQEGTDVDASVLFTAENGVSLRLTPGFEVASIKRNDVVIGRLTRSNLRVDYSDGSYEQY
jgi:hypothetical protein